MHFYVYISQTKALLMAALRRSAVRQHYHVPPTQPWFVEQEQEETNYDCRSTNTSLDAPIQLLGTCA